MNSSDEELVAYFAANGNPMPWTTEPAIAESRYLYLYRFVILSRYGLQAMLAPPGTNPWAQRIAYEEHLQTMPIDPNQQTILQGISNRSLGLIALSACCLLFNVMLLATHFRNIYSEEDRKSFFWVFRRVSRGKGQYIVSNTRLVFCLFNIFTLVTIILRLVFWYLWNINGQGAKYEDAQGSLRYLVPLCITVSIWVWGCGFIQSYMTVEIDSKFQIMSPRVTNILFLSGVVFIFSSQIITLSIAWAEQSKLLQRNEALKKLVFEFDAVWSGDNPTPIQLVNLEQAMLLIRASELVARRCSFVAKYALCIALALILLLSLYGVRLVFTIHKQVKNKIYLLQRSLLDESLYMQQTIGENQELPPMSTLQYGPSIPSSIATHKEALDKLSSKVKVDVTSSTIIEISTPNSPGTSPTITPDLYPRHDVIPEEPLAIRQPKHQKANRNVSGSSKGSKRADGHWTIRDVVSMIHKDSGSYDDRILKQGIVIISLYKTKNELACIFSVLVLCAVLMGGLALLQVISDRYTQIITISLIEFFNVGIIYFYVIPILLATVVLILLSVFSGYQVQRRKKESSTFRGRGRDVVGSGNVDWEEMQRSRGLKECENIPKVEVKFSRGMEEDKEEYELEEKPGMPC